MFHIIQSWLVGGLYEEFSIEASLPVLFNNRLRYSYCSYENVLSNLIFKPPLKLDNNDSSHKYKTAKYA